MELEQVRDLSRQIVDEIERAVVGKRESIELVLLGLLGDGHVLLEDYPGLAKTLTARSFAQVTEMRFARVQFTPDLMPADVTGSSIWNQRDADFEFRPGAIFANLLCSSARSSCSRPRTRSSTRARTRCPRPSSTASCYVRASAIRPRTPNGRCSSAGWSGRWTRSPSQPSSTGRRCSRCKTRWSRFTSRRAWVGTSW